MFGLQYQPLHSSRKEAILARVFNYRYCLIIYVIVHNVIPQKSGQGEVQYSDIYFLDHMFHNRKSPYARISLPNIIISNIRTVTWRSATSYRLGFPRLLSLIFERKGVNLEGIPQAPVRPMDELNIVTLTDMGIPTDNLPCPGRDRSKQAGQTE